MGVGCEPTVLIVDDNAGNRALARSTLEEDGYHVVTAATGIEGVAAFAQDPVDCVLLDVRMPGVDGFEVCRRIRKLPLGVDVPIVFVTAQRDIKAFDHAVAAGGDDFISKPYQPNELKLRVKAALEKRLLSDQRNELYDVMKRQREDMQRLQLQKEQMISFLVHDLKSPVNSIELQAQNALRDPDAGDRFRRCVEHVRDESRRLSRMITNLLDLAKADETGLTPATESIDLAALIGDLSETFAVRTRCARVRVEQRVPSVSVIGDRNLLRRVIDNLLDNAIRYAPEDSEVSVVATHRDGGVELRVADAGPGVPRELRDRVFERYTQLDHHAPRSNHGLGLTFCKVVVEAHGGRIWIEDASPGAVFCIWLRCGSDQSAQNS